MRIIFPVPSGRGAVFLLRGKLLTMECPIAERDKNGNQDLFPNDQFLSNMLECCENGKTISKQITGRENRPKYEENPNKHIL